MRRCPRSPCWPRWWARAALAAPAATPATPRSAKPAIACLIGPERTADIGSPVIAVVDAIKVDNGDLVSAGQPLVLLRSAVENAGVQAAEERARIDADVRAAEANLTLAKQRHQRTVQLREQGFVSTQATDQSRAEQDVAQQKLEQARSQKRVSTRDLGVVRAQLDQRTVRSPFDGVVVDRLVNAGERVDDKPLLRLAMLNPLRVEVVLPASRYGSVALGDSLQVLPELANARPVSARVSQVDRVIDPGQQHLPRAPEAAQPRQQAARRRALPHRPAGRACGGRCRTAAARARPGSGTAAQQRPVGLAFAAPADGRHGPGLAPVALTCCPWPA